MPTPDARYRNVVRAITTTPWAILPEAFDVIADLINLRLAGGHLSAEEIEQRIAAGRGTRQSVSAGAVALIPITGVLMPRATLMSALSGATALSDVASAIDAAAADPEISAIVLDVDSPGGSVTMVPETAARIRAASASKRVFAVASGTAASAAYWLASQADELVAGPSSLVGSIGVLAAHENHAGADEQRGVETTLIHAGRYKVEGHAHGPLEDEARGEMQRLVDEFYGMFVADVAKGRGVSAAAVRADYGEGRVLTARRALAAGMVDRIDTLDATVARALRAPKKPPAGARALGITPEQVAAAFDLPVEAVAGPTEIDEPDAREDQGQDAPATDRERDLLAQISQTLTDTTTRLEEA